MVDLDLIRAPLFVPANRPDRYRKAATSGTDAVILDLEDAIAPADKYSARAALCCDFTDLLVIVRINPAGTPWHLDDIAAVQALPGAAVMLPKCEDEGTLARVAEQLPGAPILALVETARGLANARAIAAHPAATRLAFGSVDYCADLGCAHERDALLAARCELVLAARLAGRSAPLDGVTTNIGLPEAAYDDALHARRLGMTGKLCIHPRQVAEVRRAFAPSEEEQVWAKRVLAAGDGAVSLDGEMIDEPVRIHARSILAAAGKA